MTDPHKGRPSGLAVSQWSSSGLDGLGRRRVERSGRLVEEEHGRLELDRADERDDLGLAAGEVAARLGEKRASRPRIASRSMARLRIERPVAMGPERNGYAQVFLDAALERAGRW